MIALFFATAADAGDTCIDPPYVKVYSAEETELRNVYLEIAPVLDRFPSLGEALTEMAPQLCFSSKMDNAHGYLDVDDNRIVLSEELSSAMRIAVLLHELRHLEQLALGICPSDNLAMGEYARATFALEADASAISLLVAWDMKEHGDDSAWVALSVWPSQNDIARRFEEEMAKSGDAAAATAFAFDQWHASGARRELYYLASCSDYLDRQDAGHTLPRYQLVPDDFFEQLCRMPDGGSYHCSIPYTDPR